MKIYLVMRGDAVGYDEYDGFVVRAEDERAARRQAEIEATGEFLSNEEWGYWFAESTTVQEVTADGKPGVILGSFNAG